MSTKCTLFFSRIWGFLCNIFYLQKHTKLILFWYKCNTIGSFLHNQWNLICFQIINILYKLFLELLVQVIIKFVFFQVRIIYAVFRVLIMTFPEKFCLMYNLISYLGVCHNELRQNRCCSWVIFFVGVYYLCLVGLLFHQCSLCFLGDLLGCMSFRRLLYDVLRVDFLRLFLCSCRHLVRIQQEYWILCFIKWFVVFTCKFCFRVNLETLFLYYECF